MPVSDKKAPARMTSIPEHYPLITQFSDKIASGAPLLTPIPEHYPLVMLFPDGAASETDLSTPIPTNSPLVVPLHDASESIPTLLWGFPVSDTGHQNVTDPKHSDLHWRRSKRQSKPTPSSLRFQSHHFKSKCSYKRPDDSSRPTLIQVTPKIRHASSGFYYPEILQPYGISPEDWQLFTQQFIAANIPSSRSLSIFAWVVPLNFWLLAFASFGVVTGAMFLAIEMMEAVTYLALKRRRLRKFEKNGTLAVWIDEWNTHFFQPKGLSVDFHMPKKQRSDAPVAPKLRFWSRPLGRYHKPSSTRKATRRARISITRIGEPVAEVGWRPETQPIRISRAYRVLTAPKKVLRLHWWLIAKLDAEEARLVEIRRRRVERERDGGGVRGEKVRFALNEGFWGL